MASPSDYAAWQVRLRRHPAWSEGHDRFRVELQIALPNPEPGDRKSRRFSLATAAHHSFLSAMLVKEVVPFGGDVRHMVPPEWAKDSHQAL